MCHLPSEYGCTSNRKGLPHFCVSLEPSSWCSLMNGEGPLFSSDDSCYKMVGVLKNETVDLVKTEILDLVEIGTVDLVETETVRRPCGD